MEDRITPRATVKLFRELVFWLNLYGLQPQDIMPVAGIDPGTLHGRFTDAGGAIVGKTGTLPGTDGGVSTLAGILYTRERGVLLAFVVQLPRLLDEVGGIDRLRGPDDEADADEACAPEDRESKP